MCRNTGKVAPANVKRDRIYVGGAWRWQCKACGKVATGTKVGHANGRHGLIVDEH